MADNNDRGNFTWPQLSTGKTSDIQCPFQPIEDDDSLKIATRKWYVGIMIKLNQLLSIKSSVYTMFIEMYT